MLLTAIELPIYFPTAANMTPSDQTVFLARANAYCIGEIGGLPPILEWDPLLTNLKGIVAAAFEIIAEAETAEIDEVNGNVTEAAPTRPGKAKDPLTNVIKMLAPYKAAYERGNESASDDGYQFLGGI